MLRPRSILALAASLPLLLTALAPAALAQKLEVYCQNPDAVNIGLAACQISQSVQQKPGKYAENSQKNGFSRRFSLSLGT